MVGVATTVVCLYESQPVLYHRLFDAKCSGYLKPGNDESINTTRTRITTTMIQTWSEQSFQAIQEACALWVSPRQWCQTSRWCCLLTTCGSGRESESERWIMSTFWEKATKSSTLILLCIILSFTNLKWSLFYCSKRGSWVEVGQTLHLRSNFLRACTQDQWVISTAKRCS